MKAVIAVFSALAFIGCSTISPLNKGMDASSKSAIKSSPFAAAPKASSALNEQKKFRQVYLDVIQKMKKQNHQDTIVLTEFYEYSCGTCPAEYVDIQTPTQIQLFDKSANGSYVFRKTISSSSKKSEFEIYSFQVQEILKQLRKTGSWNKNPQYYGNDKCKDGAHTFYTLFFPDGRVESMYMRCWTLRPDGSGHW